MLALKFIAAAAVLAQGVLSEGVHLFNCSPWGAAGSERIWRSLVAVRGSLLVIPPLPPCPPADDPFPPSSTAPMTPTAASWAT